MLLLVVGRVEKVAVEEADCTLLVEEDMLGETLAEEDIVVEEDMVAGEGRLRYILMLDRGVAASHSFWIVISEIRNSN